MLKIWSNIRNKMLSFTITRAAQICAILVRSMQKYLHIIDTVEINVCLTPVMLRSSIVWF